MATTTKKSRKKARRARRIRIVLFTALGILLALGAVAVTVPTVHYRTRFLPDTQVAGVYCGDMTAPEAADALYAALERQSVTLRDAAGETLCALPFTEFMSRETMGTKAQGALEAQQAEAGLFGWMLYGHREFAPRVLEDVTAEDTAAAIETALYADTPRVEPADAYIELGEAGYTVVPEVAGNAVDMDVCAAAVAQTLGAVEDLSAPVPDAAAEGALLRPAVTVESPAITDRTAAMDAYLGTQVTIDLGSGYTLTPEDIWAASQIALTEDGVDCAPDEALVQTLMEQVIADNGLDGLGAKFRQTAETRTDLHYREGDEGWRLDHEALAVQVYDALAKGESATVTGGYDYTWYWKQVYPGYGVGDNLIEISIENQYMWCYRNGQLLLETPVVTGNLADPGSHTRTGCFRVTYKVTDTVLRGPTWDDHVDYWMPFDDQIGLHDSSWRDEYGGDIYLEDGSHGCINTPLDAMSQVYANYAANDMVIVW